VHTVFTTDNLPTAERLPHFDAFQLASSHPMGVRSDDPQRFRATALALDLGEVNLVDLRITSSRVLRTPRMIRRVDPEVFSVLLARKGSVGLSQGGQEVSLTEGTMALYSSSRPFEVAIGEDSRLLRLQVPQARLPLPAPRLERLVAVPVNSRQGLGALFSGYLDGLASEASHYSPAEFRRLGDVTLDLLAAALAHHSEAELPDPTRDLALLPQITSFIDQHLDDPELAPTAIARAHHISVSYLHRLFHGREETVGSWIRRRRLERARRDLTDPTLGALPIHRIASRWGFTDHATFTRAFRATYGVPPRDYRRTAGAPAAS
jgi:AraC-like DNA-binding protein